jgi:cation diffusion facilitator CzcD-associated flavoprotein CzcO
MSIKLALKGIDHIVIEKENDIGGTWLLSRYPGVSIIITPFARGATLTGHI